MRTTLQALWAGLGHNIGTSKCLVRQTHLATVFASVVSNGHGTLLLFVIGQVILEVFKSVKNKVSKAVSSSFWLKLLS